jgi:hypothetical protein
MGSERKSDYYYDPLPFFDLEAQTGTLLPQVEPAHGLFISHLSTSLRTWDSADSFVIDPGSFPLGYTDLGDLGYTWDVAHYISFSSRNRKANFVSVSRIFKLFNK